MKYDWIHFLILAVLMASCPERSQAAATEPYGLNSMAQFDRLPYLKPDTMAGGQSSFDRTGGNSDFSNFLYTNGTEKVLLDLVGPGTVYRIWVTGFNRSTDDIKVYFDGETTPRISMLLRDLFVGTNAPFLTPLVGDDSVSSGGFYCYLPLPFRHGIRITSNASSGSFYYNIGYHLYTPDATVATWTGKEDSGRVRNLWMHAGTDLKNDAGNAVVSNVFTLEGGTTNVLLDISGPASISSLKLHIPGTEPPPEQPFVADKGRAHKGYSQFQMAIAADNSGVELVRRMDYGIGNQVADVYVDGSLVGRWSTPGSDGTYHWRDSSFNIPAHFTTNKSAITVKVAFVSSDFDWNEFHYWAYSDEKGTTNLTDTLDVGNGASERSHDYVINTQTWSGDRTYQYVPAGGISGAANLLTNLWLEISFDDETNPSVCAPIGSFFAVGQFASYFTRALPVGMDVHSNFYCYFPMPFASHATVQLVNHCNQAVTNVQFEARYKPFTGSFANVGYFKTEFRSEAPTTNGSDIIMLDREGAGQLVGVVENMMGPLNRSYLEGDERIYVDDSESPAFYGTGTEDFYNSGWYFDRGTFSLPLHGNSAHLVAGHCDCTTAYRLFIQDAIPFRRHIRAGIEHGTENSVPENVWTLAYYYYQPDDRAIETDVLNVGDAASESAHAYHVSGESWSGTLDASYDGDFDDVNISDDGRAHRGYSQFRMKLTPMNAGAILRRRLDQGVANQKAKVYVDGRLVGTWYRAGGNACHHWRDDDFLLPAKFTAGKSSIEIKVQFVSSSKDWNEFKYTIYSLKPTAGK